MQYTLEFHRIHARVAPGNLGVLSPEIVPQVSGANHEYTNSAAKVVAAAAAILVPGIESEAQIHGEIWI